MDPRPVGIFDSGVGGLSVLRAFRGLALAEDIIYFADTAYFPYGPRPAAEVRKRAFAIVHRLMKSDVKLVVVACNTASAASIEDLRAMFDIPFVGMVPGLKPAAAVSRTGAVAILATPGTLDGGLYARVNEEFGRGTSIINVAGHGLAEIVERGQAHSPEAHAAIRDCLGPAVRRGADVVVLGCTHYHFLQDVIREEFPALQFVDTAEPVARRAVALLEEGGIAAAPGRTGHLNLVVSGDTNNFREIMAGLGFEPEGVLV